MISGWIQAPFIRAFEHGPATCARTQSRSCLNHLKHRIKMRPFSAAVLLAAACILILAGEVESGVNTVALPIARNFEFGRSLRIPDASLQTSVNFPRTRPLKCMEQTAFLFNLNQERTEMKNSFKITVKHIISYALFIK